jgi:superfamily I DNA/RNA helicase
MATHTSSPRTCNARKKRLPMKVSKGLGFPVVALPSAGHMPAKGGDQQEAARVFYVAAKRAKQRLVIGVGGGAIRS